MKLLSLTQPWATLVAVGLKKFETRSWSTSYRGELAIHATKGPTDEMALAAIASVVPEALALTYVHGAVIATCVLDDCVTMNERIISSVSDVERALGDWRVGRSALRLTNVKQLSSPLVIDRGARGAPVSVSEELRELIVAATSRQTS